MPRCVRLLLTLFSLVTAPALLHAQGTGRVVGRIFQTAGGSPLSGVQVEIAGTALRATSALDGRYTLLNVPAGTVTISARAIGYQPKTVTGIVVASGGAAQQDITLSAQVVELEEIAVTAEAERGSVNRAIDEQRSSVNIVSAIAAEQIQRSPDRDAAQAVQRVSGVTVQDGKFVFVRGLGERYTTTSLNGSRVPSPDPERRVVPLDLFPASLLEGITTSKTFTPEQSGDFAGAEVNLKTREFPARRTVTFTASAGLNDQGVGSDVLKAPTTGSEWIGLAGGDRAIPRRLGGINDDDQLGGAGQGEINGIIGSFRNAWSGGTGNGRANGSFGASVGGEDPVFGQLLGYIASLTYNTSQELRQDELRSLPEVSNDVVQARNVRSGATGRVGVSWGGILNLSTRIGSGTKLSLNNSLTRTADNEVSRLQGTLEEFQTAPFDLTRITYTTNVVRSNQLAAEHGLGARTTADWNVTTSRVRRYEPDRSDLAYQIIDGTAQWNGAPRSATRTFSDLVEENWTGGLNLRRMFGSTESPWSLKVGAQYRATDRDAESRAYDIINAPVNGLTAAERSQPAERIFDGLYAAQGRLRLQFNNNGGLYTAEDRLAAGFAQVEFPVSDRLGILIGARIENDRLEVNSLNPITGAAATALLDNTDILPALTANFALTGDQTVRFSVSQTVSRPQYRELSPVEAFEPIGGITLFGNPDLRRSLIQNLDLRWEWYPTAGEVVSVGAFYKHFNNPIERVLVSGQSLDYTTFINAEGATDYGLELELRKNLGFLASGLSPLSAFTNSTIMRSRVQPGTSSEFTLDDRERNLVGQADYVVNAGLTYTGASGEFTSTLLYNVVGPRITEATTIGLPNVTERPRHLVDFSLQTPIVAGLSAKFDARNLFDAPVRVTQGPITRLRYTSGRVFSLGFRWGL